jgi:hypothetical protein
MLTIQIPEYLRAKIANQIAALQLGDRLAGSNDLTSSIVEMAGDKLHFDPKLLLDLEVFTIDYRPDRWQLKLRTISIEDIRGSWLYELLLSIEPTQIELLEVNNYLKPVGFLESITLNL